MAKVKIHEFSTELYPFKIWVAKSINNVSWINDMFCEQDGGELELPDVHTANASTFPIIREKGSDLIGCLIILHKESALQPFVIAHEAIHAVNGMFRFLGIHQDCLNDEHYAYTVGFVVDCAWQVVTGKFKDQ